MEVSADPFLEAGIDIPKELPYQKKKVASKLNKIGSRRNSRIEQGNEGASIGASVASSVTSVAKATQGNTMVSIGEIRYVKTLLHSD